jgi:hypothetical protein
VHSICMIFTLLYPYLNFCPFILVSSLPGRTCSTLLFSNFAKEKKKKSYFCLLKIALEGVSLWPFHVYMNYSPILFISSIFLLSTVVPFLWLFQPV